MTPDLPAGWVVTDRCARGPSTYRASRGTRVAWLVVLVAFLVLLGWSAWEGTVSLATFVLLPTLLLFLVQDLQGREVTVDAQGVTRPLRTRLRWDRVDHVREDSAFVDSVTLVLRDGRSTPPASPASWPPWSPASGGVPYGRGQP